MMRIAPLSTISAIRPSSSNQAKNTLIMQHQYGLLGSPQHSDESGEQALFKRIKRTRLNSDQIAVLEQEYQRN